MQKAKAKPNPPVILPGQRRLTVPKTSHASPQRQTESCAITPDGIGRSFRCRRSNSASNASFKNIPPTYRKVAPAKRNGRFSKFPPPPSHHPAKQFDQTVGRFETRPRIKNVRMLFTFHISRFPPSH